MNNSLDVTIRDWLARYLAGEIGLGEFQEWFVPATWDQPGKGDSEIDALIGEIELRLAEYTGGHRDEKDLRTLLVPLVTNYRIRIGAPIHRTASTAVTTTRAVGLPVESAGTVRLSLAVPA